MEENTLQPSAMPRERGIDCGAMVHEMMAEILEEDILKRSVIFDEQGMGVMGLLAEVSLPAFVDILRQLVMRDEKDIDFGAMMVIFLVKGDIPIVLVMFDVLGIDDYNTLEPAVLVVLAEEDN